MRLLRAVGVPLALLGSLSGAAAWADEPPLAPSPQRVCSHSGRFCARMDPDTWRTQVVRVGGDGSESALWSMPGWFRVAALADDGEHLVVGDDGQGLLPDYRGTQVVLTFFRGGVRVREVQLGEVVRYFWMLRRSASHWGWGFYRGIDEAGRYVLVTEDGLWPWRGERLHRFDVTTGEPVR
jgi:hypothetical protein